MRGATGPPPDLAVAEPLGIGACIAAVVLGIVALAQIRRTRQRGTGLAVAGMVRGCATPPLWIIFIVVGLAIGCRPPASMLLTSQPRNHVPARQVKGNVDAVPGADAGQDVNRAGEGAGGRLFHEDASVGDAAAAWSQTAAWAGVLPLPVVQVRPAG